MASKKREASISFDWDTQMAINTELFFEADRLERAAYDIISTSLADAAAWMCFTEAKQVADAKRTEAYQDLIRIRRALEGERLQARSSPLAEQKKTATHH